MARVVPIALLLGLLLAAPAAASSTQSVSYEAPRELLSDELREGTLDEISALGVRSLRVVMYWQSVAPSPESATRPAFDAADPDAYPAERWGPFDRLLGSAARRGMRVLITVSGPVPRWATAGARDNVTSPKPEEFQRFMTAVGRRYRDVPGSWSIWNEPNGPQFLKPQFRSGKPYSPRLYRRLFVAGQRGLRASGNGSDPILMGETAPRGTGSTVAPVTFLRGVLCLSSRYRRSRSCGRLDADGYAHHAYTTRAGPSFRPRGANDVTIGVLSRLTRALDRAGRAGAIRRNLPLHLTEFGVQSEPDPFLGVSLAQQAEFRSIAEHIAYSNRRVRAFSQYLMRDDDPRPGSEFERYSGFESGLRFADGRAKPSYDEFRTPLHADRRGDSVALWGLIRPATGATSLTVEYADGGSDAFQTLLERRTNARGRWSARTTHRSDRRFRVRWTDPAGRTFVGPSVRAY